MSDDVSVDPRRGGGVGGPDCEELVVGHAYHDPNLGSGEGIEDVWVGVVEADMGYLLRLEERNEVCRREEFRNVCADVDSHVRLSVVGGLCCRK